MASAIPGFTPNLPASTPSTSTGVGGMTASDFLNLMITQLQQQDPLNPTDSNQLLTQMSQISNLQSNQSMQTSLTGLTLQQSIGAGGNLIGKNVQGLDANGNNVQGIVTSIKVQNQSVYLETSTGEIPMANVTNITLPPTAPAGSAATAATTATAAAAAAAATPQLAAPAGTTPVSNSSSNAAALMSLLASMGAK